MSSAVDQFVALVNDGCALPHQSVQTAALPASHNWRNELFGVTREPAVIVYNRDLVPPEEAPRSRFDLIDLLRPADSRFAGRVATYDIEASGVGYLLAFTDSQQATTFGSLIEAFARSGAVATCCSAEIIDGVAEGRYLIAYNVLGSYALTRAADDPRIAVVAPEDYTLVLSRAAMIPKGAANPTAAGLLIDFMLSDAGRAALAEQFLIARDEAGGLPEDDASLYRPIRLTPALLLGLDGQKRASFLARWRATFSRAVSSVRERPRPSVAVEGDEGEGGAGDLLAHLLVAAAPPGGDVDVHRRPPAPGQGGEERDLVADLDRQVEAHAVDGDRRRPAPRGPRREVAGGEVHLAHQPPAEDVSGGVGVGRHGDGADHRLALRGKLPAVHQTTNPQAEAGVRVSMLRPRLRWSSISAAEPIIRP